MNVLEKYLKNTTLQNLYLHKEADLCRTGNISRLREMKIKDLDDCLYTASEYGHIDVVKYLMEGKIIDERLLDSIYESLCEASYRGHINIVKYFIEEGWVCDQNIFNHALCEASSNGHIDVVIYLIEKGATDINRALIRASFGGHIDVVIYLAEIGAYSFVMALRAAINGNRDPEHPHTEVIRYLEGRIPGQNT